MNGMMAQLMPTPVSATQLSVYEIKEIADYRIHPQPYSSTKRNFQFHQKEKENRCVKYGQSL